MAFRSTATTSTKKKCQWEGKRGEMWMSRIVSHYNNNNNDNNGQKQKFKQIQYMRVPSPSMDFKTNMCNTTVLKWAGPASIIHSLCITFWYFDVVFFSMNAIWFWCYVWFDDIFKHSLVCARIHLHFSQWSPKSQIARYEMICGKAP